MVVWVCFCGDGVVVLWGVGLFLWWCFCVVVVVFFWCFFFRFYGCGFVSVVVLLRRERLEKKVSRHVLGEGVVKECCRKGLEKKEEVLEKSVVERCCLL